MNSPTPATMATARAMAIRRSARRWSPVRARLAGPCSVWRSTSTGSLSWSLSVMTSRSASRSVSAPPGDPAGGHDQDAEAEHPGHEPLGDRPLAADGGAALVVGGGAQALDVGGDVVDVLAALGGAELVLDQAAPDRHLPWPILIASATSWGWTFWRDTAMFSPPRAAPAPFMPWQAAQACPYSWRPRWRSPRAGSTSGSWASPTASPM